MSQWRYLFTGYWYFLVQFWIILPKHEPNSTSIKLNSDEFECQCVEPFKGDFCHLGGCKTLPCLNFGRCTDVWPPENGLGKSMKTSRLKAFYYAAFCQTNIQQYYLATVLIYSIQMWRVYIHINKHKEIYTIFRLQVPLLAKLQWNKMWKLHWRRIWHGTNISDCGIDTELLMCFEALDSFNP